LAAHLRSLRNSCPIVFSGAINMAHPTSHPHFATQSRTVLSGSEKSPDARATQKRPASHDEELTVSVIVRRKKPLSQEHSSGRARISRARFNADHGADPAAVALVQRFAREFGLEVEDGAPAPGRRTLKLTGTVANMQRAFGVTLSHATIEGQTYRVRDGDIRVPSELQGYVVAVLGLDNRPQAKPHFRVSASTGFAREHAASGFSPVEVGQLYQFPEGTTAADQTIGIIELGGGFRQNDLDAYFKSLGLETPEVIAVPVGNGKNNPGGPNGADGEVMLDVEVCAAVAPGARIVLYFAPNTDQGFVDAIAHAVHDTENKPSVISISWGAAEINWTRQAMMALDAACQSAAALGVTITAAAGDDGSSDGVNDGKNHVDFPASSPHVLACGGTRLAASDSAISSETVWNDPGGGATGGGFSTVFPRPSWQANISGPLNGRGVPDVAGDADPETGYNIRVDGQNMTIGGTSAVAPLWAGLIAVANQQNGKPAGFIQPAIYAAKNKTAFRDIVDGNNGNLRAGPGWDPCTGLGSPIVPSVIAAIKPGAIGAPLKIAASRTKVATRRGKRR
jgi:kumamolisin